MKDKLQTSKEVTLQIVKLLNKNDNDPEINLAGLIVACCALAHSMEIPQERLVGSLDSAWKFVELASKKAYVQ